MTCRKGDLNDDLSDMNYGRVSKWHYLNSYKETNNVSQNGEKKSLNGEEESANNYNHVQMPKYSVLSLKKKQYPVRNKARFKDMFIAYRYTRRLKANAGEHTDKILLFFFYLYFSLTY